jgi:cyclase
MAKSRVRVRIIPCLLLDGSSLVKTVRFREAAYIGDPANTVRIFNELEVDELCVLDIRATKERREPSYALLEEIASEAFMPLSYGGGVRDVETVGRLLRIGFEKVVVNTALRDTPQVVRRAADAYGSQAIVASIDVRKKFLGRYEVMVEGGSRATGDDPVTWARRAEQLGAGEILLTAIDREGTWTGFDTALVSAVTRSVSVPVIAHGGAGSVRDIGDAVRVGGASAVALGSMVVFQGKDLGVLVSFPEPGDLDAATGRKW